ncbi:MAG: hypothetical protein SNJ71_00380 [Bacteroidales bacterium]
MNKKWLDDISEDIKHLIRKSGSYNPAEAIAAQHQLALAVQEPIRAGILDGLIVDKVFTPMKFEPGVIPEFPLDIVEPGTEDEYAAYTVPNYGYIPQRHVDGDYLTVPTYDIAAAIDWSLKYSRDCRWPLIVRALYVLEQMFVKKHNYDGFRCLIAAGADRNLLVTDSYAPNGFFTKRLVSLLKLGMRRGGGGNSASLNRIQATHIFISPEGYEDVRSWDLTQIDDLTRNEIFHSEENVIQIFGVELVPLDELGVGRSYQHYYTDTLGGTMGPGDEEICIAVDLNDQSGMSFVMPVREEVTIYPDESLHRQRKQGFYGWAEQGFAVLDNRKVLIGSF